MKRTIFLSVFLILVFGISTNQIKAQAIEVEVPEAYELANIILALTEYGQADPWEVQKIEPYYSEIKRFFEPVKNHPLLDSVNYSREQWDNYLSFRTDAYVFAFDENGLLKRTNNFYANYRANKPLTPFDNQLDLINDFVKQSNFREFYKTHQALYRQIIDSYIEFYYINETKKFLNEFAPNSELANQNTTYKIVISPLVGRMNCHRPISKNVVADFPTISDKFVSGGSLGYMAQRLSDNHTLFTEMDHGYVNPISDQFKDEINTHFNFEHWDKKSGYKGINCFNEYMTWAVYDLFVQKMAPQLTDSVCVDWHYQNADRGFIASDLFAEKLLQLHLKNKDSKLADLYPEMLKWTASIQNDIAQPVLLNVNPDRNISEDGLVSLSFSEPMNTQKVFGIKIRETKNKERTGNQLVLTLDKKKNKVKWAKDGKQVSFVIGKQPYDSFQIQLNWWEIKHKLVSQKGIMLKPLSFVQAR